LVTNYSQAFKPFRKDLFFIKPILLFVFSVFYGFTSAQSDNLFDYSSKEEQLIKNQIKKANYYLEVNLDSAIFFGNNAFQNAQQEKQPGLEYEAAKLIADAWFYKDSLASAIDYYRMAADIIKEIDGEYSEKYGARLSDVGYCFSDLGIFDLAIEYYNKSLDIFIASNNRSEIGNQLNNIGTVYFKSGNYNLAIEYLSRTLNYDSKLNDSLALSSSYNNIGKVYEAWAYYDLAIEHYFNSLNLLGERGNDARKAIRLSNIGTSYYRKGILDSALIYINAALKIDQQLNNQFKIAIRYNEIANVFSAMENYADAIDYNQKSLKILQSLNRNKSETIVLTDLGAIYFKNANYQLAEQYLLESLSISKKIGSLADEMSAYRTLIKVYENSGDLQKAIDTHLYYDYLKDSIFNSENHKQLANYRIKYETAKKEKENEILIKDIFIKKRTQRTLIIIGGFLLISVILLFFLSRLKLKTFKQDKKLSTLELEKREIEKQHLEDKVFAEKQLNRLQREKYEAEIQLKNRELVSSTLQLVNKNEVLTEIKNKIRHNNSVIPENAYNDLIQLLNQNTDFDQNWKKFRTEFEKINPGFFDRIRHQYPDFSEQFVRLSAFLRIELTTKEIAQLMNVSVAAVNKNRQRLRKKLDLELEADLSTFLKSI